MSGVSATVPGPGPGPGARLWPLALGLAVLGGLWTGPLPDLARTSFSWHMILHLGVMVAAAPLLAIGLARLRPLPAGLPLVGLAIAGSLVELGVVWAWHAPALHEAAALRPGVFALQQASFLTAGLVVWLPGLAAQSRAAAGAGTVAMLLAFAHMSMLGVLLATVSRPIYAPAFCGGGFGLDPLEDQQFGGVLMAVGGGLPYLLGGAFFAHRLLAETPVEAPQ